MGMGEGGAMGATPITNGTSRRGRRPGTGQAGPGSAPAPGQIPVPEWPTDPNELHVPKYNQGATRTERVRFTPSTMEAVERLIESGRTPWATKGEFIRCGVDLLLRTIQQRGMAPQERRSMIAACRLANRIIQDEEAVSELRHTLRMAQAQITKTLAEGDVLAARRRLTEISAVLNNTDSTRPWMQEFIEARDAMRAQIRRAEEVAAGAGGGI